MKKYFILLLVFFLLAKPVFAQVSDYTVESFKSDLEVKQNMTLAVTEIIEVNFEAAKHGIFRIIPIIYTNKGQTIKADLKLISVTDSQGVNLPATVSRYKQSLEIKIGDPNKTIIGRQTYVLSYEVKDVVLSYPDHEEVYWNVTGSEWDTVIKFAEATLTSAFAPITQVDCFASQAKAQAKDCTAESSSSSATFTATTPLTWGNDFTIVTALDKNNSLIHPNLLQKIDKKIKDNWGYGLALLPLTIIFLAWFKKGRDLKYLTDNVYIRPFDSAQGKPIVTAPLLTREHLPLVYSPIKGLTPAEVGTIIDEKVDTKDVVAEIVELSRLGFLEIKKVSTNKFLHTDTDYLFIKKDKDTASLKGYQTYLLDKLFNSGLDLENASKFLKNDQSDLAKKIVKKALTTPVTATSLEKLKYHFYRHLEGFKNELFNNLSGEIFVDNPQKVKTAWGAIAALIFVPSAWGVFMFFGQTQNFFPVAFLLLTILPIALLIKNLPRRTAWGHSLYRQIVGLKYYVTEGKWREEIAEKNLFLEEILPLAISLGVVNQLAKDMNALGLKPPTYLEGFTAANFASELSGFSRETTSALATSPANSSWSGSSSWSGGSGFSGGSSGGGFGGGGGGSW
ncbi:MAG: DUF2207 domain-containing protein [Patescibacteria group bacterium]|nr:DUF2207 domain-containing protein [Patescibacteria group bacterium]